MPTIRSAYSMEQFEEAFRKRAYKLALERIQNLPKLKADIGYDRLLLEAYGPKITKLHISNKESVTFEGGQISFSINDSELGYMSFTIDRKLYHNSPHTTRITFQSNDVRKEGAKIQTFIDALMAGIKSAGRFSLSQLGLSQGNIPESPATDGSLAVE